MTTVDYPERPCPLCGDRVKNLPNHLEHNCTHPMAQNNE